MARAPSQPRRARAPATRRARHGGPVGRAGALRRRMERLPLLVMFASVGSAAMLVPAAFGFSSGDADAARPFLHSALFFGLMCWLVAAARASQTLRRPARNQLLALLGAYALLPAMLAVPFSLSLGSTTPINAWLEMVSALTTTGFSLYDPERLSDTVHLWRATVGWIGGLFLWISAAAILAPMNLGGFEVASTMPAGEGGARISQIVRVAEPSERLARYARHLAPVYAALTAMLWGLLTTAGAAPFEAACLAMSTIATSGITVAEGPLEIGLPAEAMIAAFLVFALSRGSFADEARGGIRRLRGDPELRLAAWIIAGASAILFLRHWIGAAEGAEASDIAAALGALWGAGFTVLSFLTTTGFESSAWEEAREWSGLPAPGILLMGLALIGGGVATTAGGVKLFRVYALATHGARELDRLVYPSSVAGAGRAGRDVRRRGAQIAWVSFMLFAFSIAALTLAISAVDVPFEDSLVLAIAALSNTGPLAAGISGLEVEVLTLPASAKSVIAAGMILGRMELLAIVALLNPDLWRG